MTKEMHETISFVIPCYRSAKTLSRVVDEIHHFMEHSADGSPERYEIILVCDGSPDNTWEEIDRLAKLYPQVKGILLSRNFGQHAAILAGLPYAKGTVIVCMDDDLQTPAGQCMRLIRKLEQGYDLVYAFYPRKRHSRFRNMGSMLNSVMQAVLYGKPKGLRTSSFFAMKRSVAKKLCRYRHARPYLSGMVLRTTKKIANVPVKHRERAEGKSGYNLYRLIRLLCDGIVTAFVKPGKKGRVPQDIIAERAGF